MPPSAHLFPTDAPGLSSGRPWLAWAVVALPLLAVVLASYALLGSEDAVAAHWNLWRDRHPEATRLVKLYTDWGNPALYLVYAGILLRGLIQKRRGLTALALAYLAGQFLVSLALERLLKIGLGRPRPGIPGPFAPWSLDAQHNSLPSGHTVEMTLQTASLAVRAKTMVQPVVLGAALGLMGLSRIILGAHHPSDVLAGLALGGLGALFVGWLTPRVAERLPQKWSL